MLYCAYAFGARIFYESINILNKYALRRGRREKEKWEKGAFLIKSEDSRLELCTILDAQSICYEIN